jgi:hypothetical protein
VIEMEEEEEKKKEKQQQEQRRSGGGAGSTSEVRSEKWAAMRADRLRNLWMQLPKSDRNVPDLERRVVRRLEQQQRAAAAAVEHPNADPDDPIRRIFFPYTPSRQVNRSSTFPLSPSVASAAAGEIGDALSRGPNVSELTASVGLAEAQSSRKRGSASVPSPPPAPLPTTAARSIRELQEDQREQMETAISSMASQLRSQTQRIHATLKTQNMGLDAVEAAAESNAEGVETLARDVTDTVRKGWTRTLGTWAVLIAVAIIFFTTCLVILMVPKRPGACLVFCPSFHHDKDATVCRDFDGRKICVPVQEALESWYGLHRLPPQNFQASESHPVGGGGGRKERGVVESDQALQECDATGSIAECGTAVDTESGIASNEAPAETKADGDIVCPPVSHTEEHLEDAELNAAAVTSTRLTALEVPETDSVEPPIIPIGIEYTNALVSQGSEAGREGGGAAGQESDEVSVGMNGDVDDADAKWEVPPIPDANDVLREYMENYEAEIAAESGESDDDGVMDTVGIVATKKSEEAHIETDSTTSLPYEDAQRQIDSAADHADRPFSPLEVRRAAELGDTPRLEGYLSTVPSWVDEADHNRWTALHLAARAGNLDAVSVLLRHGADQSSETVAGDTPLDVAESYLGNDHPVTLLLRSKHMYANC